jgi:hypothetical protein
VDRVTHSAARVDEELTPIFTRTKVAANISEDNRESRTGIISELNTMTSQP